MKSNAHNADYTKIYNRNMFLRLLRQRSMSRAEITEKLGLTRAATTLIADELIRDGLVQETEAINALRGRPPKPLVLSPNAAYAIGIYLSRDGYQAGIVNFCDEVVTKIALRFDSNTGANKTALLIETIRQLIKDADVPEKKLVGIGVSCPGPIDEVKGRILNAPRFRLWANSDLGQHLKEELKLPTYLEKDASCLAHFNIGKGLTKNSNSFLLYLLEGGVGSSIVSNGVLLKSRSGFTSELGHCSIFARGIPCECGNIGCLEAYASISRLLQGSPYSSWEELIDACETDEKASSLLREEAEYLSAGVITAANLADIDTVLLSGDVRYGAEKLSSLMEEIINGRWIRRQESHIRVGESTVCPNYEIIAAADIAYDHFLAT